MTRRRRKHVTRLEEDFDNHVEFLKERVWTRGGVPVPAKKPPAPERRRTMVVALARKLVAEGLADDEGDEIKVHLQSGPLRKRLVAENPTERSVAMCTDRTLKRARLEGFPHIILASGQPKKSSR